MTVILADRVRETTAVVGTGPATLLGAVVGYQSFSVVGNANLCYYTIADQAGANWEVGIGTYATSGSTLTRTTILASSNSGSVVNFTTGTKDVFLTQPAEKAVTTQSLYTPDTFAGTFVAGVAIDYVSPNGRISVGTAGTLTFYTGGVGSTAMASMTSTGINSTAIGATTASTGAFTTLSASSTVSGTGFSTYLAAPPPIGSTTANTGAFTTLGATGAITANTTTNNQSYTTTGAGTITLTSGTTGSINNFNIGASTAGTGAFTTLSASSTFTLSGGTANGVLYLNGSKAVTSGTALVFDGTNFSTTGSATATALIPSGSTVPTNGMFLPAANTVAWSTNTTERMRIDSSGNLLVGTTTSGGAQATFGNSSAAGANRWAAVFGTNSGSAGTPSSFGLTIGWNYSIGGGENNIIYGTSAGSATGLAFSSYNGTTVTERMRIDSSGNVGIGTSSPATYGATFAVINGYITSGVQSGNAYINLYSGSASANQKFWRLGTGSGALLFETVNDAYTVPTERMRIDSSGNLLVGTTNVLEGSKLTVNGQIGAGVTYTISSSAATNISQMVSGLVYIRDYITGNNCLVSFDSAGFLTFIVNTNSTFTNQTAPSANQIRLDFRSDIAGLKATGGSSRNGTNITVMTLVAL